MRILTIFCDGLMQPYNPDGWACCAYIVFEGLVQGSKGAERPDPISFHYGCIGRPGDNLTNNIAEYRAVRAALRWCVEYASQDEIRVYTDSQLVVEQVNGRWKCKTDHLLTLMQDCRLLLKKCPRLTLRWIPREKNDVADALTRIAYKQAITKNLKK